MKRLMKNLLGATAVVAVALASTAALAIPFSGSSSGAFSALSNCGSGNCEINNGGAGANTRVEWGYNTFFGANLHNGSQLTADPTAFAGNSTQNGVTIAQLTWNNQATSTSITDPQFNVNYTLTVSFTLPVGSVGDSELFNLTITNVLNPPGDLIGGLTLADLSNISFITPGMTVSGLAYVVDNNSTYNPVTGIWANPEENVAHLRVTANFVTNPVPEPMTAALFGASLLGLGVIRRRRAANQNRLAA